MLILEHICWNKLEDKYKSTILSCRVCDDLEVMIWLSKKCPL